MARACPEDREVQEEIMNAVQVSLNSRDDEVRLLPRYALSALVDGEIDTEQLDALFTSKDDAAEVLANWHSYQVIGSALRGDRSAAFTAQPPGDFLAAVRGRLAAEAAPFVAPMPPVIPARAVAANDSVFRWQMVAGVASLAAVIAVSWTVLSGAPSNAGGSGPQLAAAPAATVTVETATPRAAASGSVPSTALVVNTGQGPLIRDARLEELLAEHRQNGGMSALQMPTGFIRSATYDAAGR